MAGIGRPPKHETSAVLEYAHLLIPEQAAALGVSTATVKRMWSRLKAEGGIAPGDPRLPSRTRRRSPNAADGPRRSSALRRQDGVLWEHHGLGPAAEAELRADGPRAVLAISGAGGEQKVVVDDAAARALIKALRHWVATRPE